MDEGDTVTLPKRLSPLALASFAVVAFLALCVAFPLLCVCASVRLNDFTRVFSSSVWLGAMLNTLVECASSSTLSVLFGFLFAYAVERARIPLFRFFSLVPIVHLVTPPFVGGLSFILLVGRQGFLTHTLLGLDVSLYGFWGLLISQVLCFFPISYMICRESLRSLNPNLEQAARGMGAGRARIFLTVTLPLVFPGILSAWLFIAVSVLSDFGNPMIVAGRFRVLAVEIYTQLTGWMNAGTSAVLGLVLVFPSVVLFALQMRILRKKSRKNATVGSKIQFLPKKESSVLTRIVLFSFCLLVSLAVLLQFASIVAGAFQRVWGVDTSFTAEHFRAVGGYLPELRNSILFSILGAALSVCVSILAAFLVGRTEFRAKPLVDALIQIPAAVPGSLFGLAFSISASLLKIRFSELMIVVAICVGFMPFSYRIISSSFSQVRTTLDDGATSLGASPLAFLRTVLVPVCSGSIFSAFLYDFVRGVGTMSAVIFLVSFSTPLSSIKILNLAEEGFWGKAAALALVLTILTFSVLGIGRSVLFLRKKR